MKATFLPKLLLWLLLLFSDRLMADSENLEYKIKAGYLYNFTKFITWPLIKGTSFNLCLFDNGPFGDLIKPIEKKSAFDRPIKIIRLDETGMLSDDLTKFDCQILFIGNSLKQKAAYERIKANLQKTTTLLVGEGQDFAANGGMIGFANKDDKIKLQINLHTIKSTGLNISAKLLEVAEIITVESHD